MCRADGNENLLQTSLIWFSFCPFIYFHIEDIHNNAEHTTEFKCNFLSSIHRRSMTVIFKCTSFYSNSTLSQIRLSDFQSGATYQQKIPPFLSRCLLPTSSQFFFANLCTLSLHVKQT